MKTTTYIILYSISNLLRTYSLRLLYTIFFDEKKNKAADIGFGIFYVAVTLEYLLIDLPILTLGLNIVGLLVIALLYHTPKTNALIGTAFALVLTCFTETIVMVLSGYKSFSFMQTGFYASYVGVSVIPFLLFLFCLIYRRFKKGKNTQAIPLSHSQITFAIPILCLFVIFQIFSFDNVANWQFLCIVIALLLLAFGTIWLYDKQLIFYEKEEQQKILLLQNKYFHNEIEHMNLISETTKNIRHDLKNHLLAIDILAQKSKDQSVIDYVNKLLTDVEQNQSYVNSGNMLINGICNYYISIAKQYNITVSYHVEYPGDLNPDEKDLTILLGNLWSNCIENAKDAEKPMIDFQLIYSKNRLIIATKNTYSGHRQKINHTFRTTKSDSLSHGIGLKNMEQVTMKYGGAMQTDCDENYFYANILIFCD